MPFKFLCNAIKVTCYHSLPPLFFLLNHLKSYSLKYGLLLCYSLMVSNIMLFLLTILPNTFSSILSNKNMMFMMFLSNLNLVKNYFRRKIITLYSNNDDEYYGLVNYLATHGISHLITPPYTPEQNGYFD